MSGRIVVFTIASMAVAMMVQALAAVLPAHAVSKIPSKSWTTNGAVYATALSEDGNTLYIGGDFTQVREGSRSLPGESLAVGSVAAIDVATGAPVRSWNPVVSGNSSTIRFLAVNNGQVFIGGNFTTVGDEPRQNLAAVNAASGRVVGSFAPEVGDDASYVYTLLAGGSRLYAGGKFGTVNGEDRGKLAAFDLDTGTLAPAWKPRTTNTVRDLEFAANGASIFISGAFNFAAGSDDGSPAPRQSIARVYTETGKLHPWHVPGGTISDPQTSWDIAVTSTRLYGGFGRGPNYAAAFRLDNGDSGTQVWRYRTVGNVQTVALSPDRSRLFIGGHFGTRRLQQSVCGGTNNLHGLASLNPKTGAIHCDWLPSLDGSGTRYHTGAWDLAVAADYLWVGGQFSGVSGRAQKSLVRFAL